MILSTFQSNEIEKNWHLIEPFLRKFFQNYENGYTIQDIKQSLLKKEAQLWTSWDAAQITAICITHLQKYPLYKVCNVWICSGTMSDDWLAFDDKMYEWAKSKQCKYIRLQGRKGWERKLKSLGWKEKEIILERVL